MKGYVNLTHTNNGKINELGDKIDNLTKNAQSDWEQTDESALDYIKNKPIIPEGSVLYPTTGQHTDGAMTQKAVTTELNRLSDNVSQLSNPNLLINGDFSINQRGQSSYSGDSIYGLDRWYQIGRNTITTQIPTGLKIEASGTGQFYNVIQQKVELDCTNLIGQYLTASCYVSSFANASSSTYSLRINCYSDNYVTRITSSQATLNVGLVVSTLLIPENTKTITVSIYRTTATNDEININYMKLEIGNIATPLSPRPYAEELALCQRYYQIRSNSYTIQPNAIDRPIPMRIDGTIGTITINETTYNYVDAEIY